MCDELVSELTDTLAGFTGEDSVKEIFWSILSYDRQNLALDVGPLTPEISAIVDSFRLFASHDSIGVVRVDCSKALTPQQNESICRVLESRYTTLVIVSHCSDTDDWTIVYPDRNRKHSLRFLSIPGDVAALERTASALGALSAVDWDTDRGIQRLEVTEHLDVFFPGGMPKQRWEFQAPEGKTSEYFSQAKAAPIADFYEKISRFPLLTEQQERGEDCDQTADSDNPMDEYRWRLVVHNIRLVINEALKMPTNYVELEDLVQEGVVGLISAARKYDKSRGARFTTYAWYWIRQGMLAAIRYNNNLIRWPAHRIPERLPLNREGSTDALSPGERFVQPLDDVTGWHGGLVEVSEDDELEREEQVEALLSSLDSLDTRQQRILRARYGLDAIEELTLEEVGQSEGVTRERVRQIQMRAVENLKAAVPSWLRDEFDEASAFEE